jgi:hypothetical protein
MPSEEVAVVDPDEAALRRISFSSSKSATPEYLDGYLRS